MKSNPDRLVIASRESRLALWQAHHVRSALQQLYPSCSVEILGLSTRGDEILDRTLSKVGGKGLFVKELEVALADGRAHLAVHSTKDVPVALDTRFSLPVIMKREDPRDAFVSPQYASLAELPAGSVVGTSSLRREAQIRHRYPQLKVAALRGNLDTRLRKLDEGQYAAIVLAAAGLKRLGLSERIRVLMPTTESLPAVGQGALSIETLASRDDVAEWLAPLNHAATSACVRAERAVSLRLGGSCSVPLAAYAELEGASLTLRALVGAPDGSRMLTARASAPAENAEALGFQVADDLLSQGADALLAALTHE
jgi:hydroxymethylbilane synthase